MNEAQEILRSLSEGFASSASVKQVFGEPIQTAGKTVVPVARVQYYMGGGWGGGEQKGEHVERPLAGGGGGGGGWVKARPVGALEITDSGVRFVRFFDAAQIVKLCLAGVAGLLILSRVLGKRK
jgi:uncharacterized spore protein YtfJ